MNRIALSIMVVAALAAGELHAQKANLPVKSGQSFNYDMAMSMDMTQTMGGQDVSGSTTGSGTMVLKAKKVAKPTIEWTLQNQDIHVTSTSDQAGEQEHTVPAGEPSTFSTDMQGRVTVQPAKSDALAIVGGGLQAMAMEQFFSPILSRTLKAGDTWEVQRTDTTNMQGLDIIFNQRVRYTYDGLIDTLGVPAHRVRTESVELTIDGGGALQGMNFAIDGDGTVTGVSYYGKADNLLLATNSNSEFNARASMTGQAAMIIPMSFKITNSLTRQK